MRKLLSTVVAVGIIASTTLTPAAYADVAAGALPSLNNATNATVTTNNANMNIQINGGQGSVGTLNWNSYNVGKDASVNYEFTAHNQTALNKVSSAGGLSQIYGKITDSGCFNCGYEGTGKIILINPNGVLFGDGANVNVNSFTASTMNGVYDSKNNKLSLTKDSNQKDFGIVVLDGAKIHGDKNVTFASKNITTYNGSQISTNTLPNVGNTAYGKVKLVTADGVNFTYYNNGAIKGISDLKTSADKMTIGLNGTITSGNIDVRNYSNNVASEINLKDATLKATKAVAGNDGNIWLTAVNKVVVEDSNFTTANAAGAENVAGGNVVVLAGQKASVGTSKINAVGDVKITSQGNDVVVDKTTITTPKDVILTAANIASIQNGSEVNANNVTVNGTKRGQVVSSNVTANKNVNLISAGELAWTNKANIKAGNDVNVTANNGALLLNNSILDAKNNVNLTSKDTISSAKLAGSEFIAAKDVNLTSAGDSVILTGTEQFKPQGLLNIKAAKNAEISKAGDLYTEKVTFNAGKNVILSSTEGSVDVKDTTKFLAAEKIYIQGKKDVSTIGGVDVNNIQTNLNAGRDVNVTLTNVGNRQNGLIAKAERNMNVTTPGTVSVSSLISGNDMTINANKVIAGLPYTTEQKLPDDLVSERSYIEVGGKFTSNVTTDNYDITASGDLTNDGQYNQRHHIQYTPDEKILLVNKRPVNNNVTNPTLPGTDNGDDRDVVHPGNVPSDNTPVVPTDPSKPNGGNTGDGGNQGGNQGGDGGNGGNQGGDGSCNGNPALEDNTTNEDTPSLFSMGALTNYTASATSRK